MTLVAEDGTGLANANTYADIAYADAYHVQRGNSAWAALTSPNKEMHLLKAMDYMKARWQLSWKGRRILDSQALPWPRFGVYDQDGFYVQINTVPLGVKDVQSELAFRSISQSLLPDVAAPGELKSESIKVDTIERRREYFSGKPQYAYFSFVEKLIEPFIKFGDAIIRE